MTVPAMKPMKMTDIPITDVEKYLSDPAWVLEQKMDGARALVSWAPEEGFTWQASGGGPLKFAAAVQHLPEIEKELLELFEANSVEAAILDGELMTEEGELRIFDVPFLVRPDVPNAIPMHPYNYRRVLRDSLFGEFYGLRVHPVVTAIGENAKREFWQRINAAGVEGGMLKHVDGIYEPGVRTKSQLKLKLVKTADVIVTSVERKFDHKGMVTHGSADLALHIRPEQDPKPYLNPVTGRRISVDDWVKLTQSEKKSDIAKATGYRMEPRTRLKVGAASLIGKDLTIDVGDVVEVAYLYWGGDALVQPRILRKRLPEEKLSSDCDMDQVPTYSRAEVTRG